MLDTPPEIRRKADLMRNDWRQAMRKLIFIAAIALLLMSCEDSVERPIDDDSDELDALPLMPLKLDNEWVYDYPGLYDEIVYWVDSTFTYTHQDSLLDMFAVKFTMGAGIYKHLYYKYDDALNRTMYWKIEPDNPEYRFRHPVDVGTQWTNEFNLFESTSIDKYSLLSKKRLITVPAGFFYCYHYQIERTYMGPDTTYSYCRNYYFKPGIGLIGIKNERTDPGNPHNIIETWERRLVSYSLE